MSLAPITVTIRVSNQSAYATAGYKDVTLYCFAVKPRWKDAENSETTPDVGGFTANSIARIREYELILNDATVREDSGDEDYASVERLSRLLYAKKLWIGAVTGSPRMYRDVATPTTAVAFWTDNNGVDLPVEVRRVSFGENGSLSPVLVLEDVMPVIGSAIS
jgi:hypothetical protein